MTHINRRKFFKTTALAASTLYIPTIIPSSALGKDGAVSPSEKITIGSIGLGIRGTSNMREFLKHQDVRVVAVCDVSKVQRQKAKEIVDDFYVNQDCKAYNDFRELIARKDIDAVCIAPPDHWHVLIGLAAARAKKDMYYEKPLGLCLEHTQALRKTIHENKTIFQFGTQQRTSKFFPFICELVRNKRIGELKTIRVGAPPSFPIPAQPEMPVPEDLDYDMWLGPAPKAPYTYQRCRPFNDKESYSSWYHNSNYCLGFILNWGIHHLDIAQWGNNTDNTTPINVEGTGTFPKEGFADCCTNWELVFNYANGVKMFYSDQNGSCKHGVRFEGSEGWVHVTRSVMDANPKSLLNEKIKDDEIHLTIAADHHRNFLDAVKSRGTTICPIDTAIHSDTIGQIANIATRLGRKLEWSPDKEKFVNDEKANKLLSRPIREPWKLEA